MRIEPSDLVGRQLQSVTTEWHEFEGVRSEQPGQIWLSIEGLGPLRLHTLIRLVITRGDAPGENGDMDVYGQIVVESGGPAPIADKVGQTILAVDLLEQFHRGRSIGIVGVVLTFATGSVGVADLGHDLVVEPWPGRWDRWNVQTCPCGGKHAVRCRDALCAEIACDHAPCGIGGWFPTG